MILCTLLDIKTTMIPHTTPVWNLGCVCFLCTWKSERYVRLVTEKVERYQVLSHLHDPSTDVMSDKTGPGDNRSWNPGDALVMEEWGKLWQSTHPLTWYEKLERETVSSCWQSSCKIGGLISPTVMQKSSWLSRVYCDNSENLILCDYLTSNLLDRQSGDILRHETLYRHAQRLSEDVTNCLLSCTISRKVYQWLPSSAIPAVIDLSTFFFSIRCQHSCTSMASNYRMMLIYLYTSCI